MAILGSRARRWWLATNIPTHEVSEWVAAAGAVAVAAAAVATMVSTDHTKMVKWPP